MLQRLNVIRGAPVLALDGELGTVKDFYFDDDTWTVRYAVVDTGSWLSGRRVLISLWALLAPDWVHRRLPVRLTQEQVRHSPDIDTHRPISRQMETASLGYYEYPLYWTGPALWGPVGAPGFIPAAAHIPRVPPTPVDERETHLRSCREVAGYHVRTRDGEQGHVDDFVIDPRTWSIEHLLVDTSNWIGGRSVLISPRSVRAIDWSAKTVEIALTRQALLDSRDAAQGRYR